ncbi:MAG: M23 family metallopeptidase [Desulfohalobiaceae bacterium]
MLIRLLTILVCLVLLPAQALPGEPDLLRISAPASASLGDPFPLRISIDRPLSAVEITWLGKRARLPLQERNGTHSGEIILGTEAGQDKPGVRWIGARARGNGCSLLRKRRIEIRKKNFPRQHLSLPEESVTLSPSQHKRYKKDKRAIGKALGTTSEKRTWSRPLRWPARGEITSTYGLDRILNGQPRSPHRGIDVALSRGTPVRATDAGRVVLTGKFLFEGRAVFIDHGRGLISMYFHLASISAREGERVERGEVIGKSGESGRSSGPHLHFGLSALDRLVNPLTLLRE